MTLVPAGGAAAAGLSATGLFLAGQYAWAGAVSAVLVGGLAVVTIDVRRRVAGIAHMSRLAADRQREMLELLVMIVGPGAAEADSSAVRHSVLGRIEATERRLLDVLSAADIRTAHSRLPDVGRTSRPAAPDL